MNGITEKSIARVEFQLHWRSSEADHEERFFTHVNLWRDILPPGLSEALLGKRPGEQVTVEYPEDSNLIPLLASNDLTLKRNQFRSETILPRYGRFYPQGLLGDLPNVFPQNIKPFRVKGIENGLLNVDLNHPFAGHGFTLKAEIFNSTNRPFDKGGECAMLLECLADGPGMQARANGSPTDFFSRGAFYREDDSDDADFYEKPRRINHIDARAIETITGLYKRFIRPGMDVLDLMSGWRSHVPPDAKLKSLVGLGMNAEEMADNPQLTDFIVHDLNRDPGLPFANHSFDLVLCTVSVEYLIHPMEVFSQVARVLKPGGTFVVTFSNRWFPPKTISLWRELHEFERLGMVMEYFQQTEKFHGLNTFSSRGWPRPKSDKYADQLATSDPVFAVWGTSGD